jgi:hypothetical protein
MTGGTVQAGRYMRGHRIYHTLRCTAIMTGSAIVGDAGMIEGRRLEGTGRMTDTAILTGQDMANFFRPGKTGIVAGCAVIDDACMIKACRQKPGGLVAVPAITVGRHMVGRGSFSSGGCTIVARGTGIIDTDKLVIKPGTGKDRGVMAHRAILDGRNVVAWFGFCETSFVARRTVIDDAGMIEHRRREAAGKVTDAAVLSGRDVADILLCYRSGTIITMTFFAVINPAGMIKHSIGERNGVMTQAAIGSGYRMGRVGGVILAGGIGTVVAGGTIARDTHMVKNWVGWSEAVNCSRMAKVTILLRRQMVCTLDKRR